MVETVLSIVAIDAAGASLRRIEALAALMGRLADERACDRLDGQTVAEAAAIISEEARRIRTALEFKERAPA